MRAHLDRHAAGDLAHRRQQRQPAARIADRLVGDEGGAGAQQPFGLLPIRRQMKIGEQHLAGSQPRDLLRLRLLHLDDHLRGGKDLVGTHGDLRAGASVGGIVEADAGAGAGFDDDLVTVMGRLADTARQHADPIFVRLHFLGHADPHPRTPAELGARRVPEKFALR